MESYAENLRARKGVWGSPLPLGEHPKNDTCVILPRVLYSSPKSISKQAMKGEEKDGI